MNNHLIEILTYSEALIKDYWEHKTNQHDWIYLGSFQRPDSISTITLALRAIWKMKALAASNCTLQSSVDETEPCMLCCSTASVASLFNGKWKREGERKKDGLKDWDVDTTHLGPTLNFMTPEILWCVSEAAEHTSEPQACYYIKGWDISLLYRLSIKTMAAGRLFMRMA